MSTYQEYSATEAAAIAGMTKPALIKHIKAGHLPARKVGIQYIIKSTDLAAFQAIPRNPGRPRKEK